MGLYPRWDTCTGSVKCRGCRRPISPGEDIFAKANGVYYCNTCGSLAEAAGDDVKPGGIEEGVIRDLDKFPGAAADTAMAKAALFLARQLDSGEVNPREVTQYTKEVRLNLLQVRDLYPPEGEPDDTDDKQRKLQERRRREQGGI